MYGRGGKWRIGREGGEEEEEWETGGEGREGEGGQRERGEGKEMIMEPLLPKGSSLSRRLHSWP